MFNLYIKFRKAELLYKSHRNIKCLKFILGNPELTIDNAHASAVAYINHYFGTVKDPVEWIDVLPATPTNQKEWDLIKPGFFCTESPTEWKLTVWRKNRNAGFLFSSFEIEKIFSISILQIKKICLDSPSKKWLAPNFRTPEIDTFTKNESQFHYSSSENSVSDSDQ